MNNKAKILFDLLQISKQDNFKPSILFVNALTQNNLYKELHDSVNPWGKTIHLYCYFCPISGSSHSRAKRSRL